MDLLAVVALLEGQSRMQLLDLELEGLVLQQQVVVVGVLRVLQGIVTRWVV